MSALVGAVVSAALSAATFTLGALLDGIRAGEALAYGLMAALIGGFAGASVFAALPQSSHRPHHDQNHLSG